MLVGMGGEASEHYAVHRAKALRAGAVRPLHDVGQPGREEVASLPAARGDGP